MRYFEDIEIGERTELGSYTFTTEDIKQFAERYDPQPFHTDEEAAARSHFGALVASGWHTASVFMKLQAQAILKRAMEPATTGVSPGFRDLRWRKPVYAGDTLSYRTEVIRKRELATRPQWGIVFNQVTAVNQHGEVALEIESSVLVARRGSPSS